MEWAAEGPAEGRDLFGVADRLGSGEAVGGAFVAVVEEDAFGDRSDVVLVDGSGEAVREDAADRVPRVDLRGPLEGVGGERVGAQEGPGEAAVADVLFGGGVCDVDGVGFVGAVVDDPGGEQDDVPYAARRAVRRRPGLVAWA